MERNPRGGGGAYRGVRLGIGVRMGWVGLGFHKLSAVRLG
jgi:hypothetical protein